MIVLASGGVASGSSKATVSVHAAASLTDAFPKIAPGAKYSFAGSNTLAAQIRLGAPADVFASANMTLPEQLYQRQALLEAGRLHEEQAHRDRPEVEPARTSTASTTCASTGSGS